MKGRLLFLIVVLLALVGTGAYLYLPGMIQEKKRDDQVSRMRLSSALLKAVVDIESQTRKWPKNVDEIRQHNHPRLKDVDLDGVTYDFVKSEKDQATYKFVSGGRGREVKVVSSFGKQREPSSMATATGQQ